MPLITITFKLDPLLPPVSPTTMSMTSLVDAPVPLLVAGAMAISTWLLIQRSRRLPFPPGPPPDPVIGNLRQMGSKDLEFVFEKWGKEYGEFCSLRGEGIGFKPFSILHRRTGQPRLGVGTAHCGHQLIR